MKEMNKKNEIKGREKEGREGQTETNERGTATRCQSGTTRETFFLRILFFRKGWINF